MVLKVSSHPNSSGTVWVWLGCWWGWRECCGQCCLPRLQLYRWAVISSTCGGILQKATARVLPGSGQVSLMKVWNAVLDQVWSFAVVAVLEHWASVGNCLGTSSWTICFKILLNMGRFTPDLQLSGNKTMSSVLKFVISSSTPGTFAARCQCLSPGSWWWDCSVFKAVQPKVWSKKSI